MLLAPAFLSAQRLAPAFATLPDPLAQPATVSSAAVFGHPDDYRWEGALAGAIVGGVAMAYVGYEFCRYDETGLQPNCVAAAFFMLLLGGVVGGGVGGLMGGLIPKEKPAP